MTTVTYARRDNVIFTEEDKETTKVEIFASINMAKKYNRVVLEGKAKRRMRSIPDGLTPVNMTTWRG